MHLISQAMCTVKTKLNILLHLCERHGLIVSCIKPRIRKDLTRPVNENMWFVDTISCLS